MSRGTQDMPHSRRTSVARLLLRPVDIVRGYKRTYFVPDLLAGLSVGAVAIPQAIAYASIADLPPHYGLYTAAVAAIVGALWGSSRYLSSGPTNATSLLVLSVLLPLAVPGTPEFLIAASALAVMAGLLRVGFAAFRFGALVTIASRPVLIGFTAGAGLLIALGQVRHLLRLDFEANPELLRTISNILASWRDTHLPSLAVGLGTVAVIVALMLLTRRIPAILLAVIAAALVVFFWQLDESGVRIVGSMPRSLPPLTGGIPDIDTLRALAVGAMAVAALGLLESMAIAQTLARKSGDRLDNNQEFFGQGIANIATGLFSGYPCSGSLTRSSLAHQAGARTSMASVITGVAILLVILLLGPAASRIPKAALAGALLVIAWTMVDRRAIARVVRTSRVEAISMVGTLVATLLLPLEFAVLAGVLLSLALFIIQSSTPRVFHVVPDAEFRHFVHNPKGATCPQAAFLNIHGPLFFGAVNHVEESLRQNLEEHPGQVNLILRMHGVNMCDISGVEMLESTVATYRKMHGDVFFVRPRAQVLRTMKASGFLAQIEDNILPQEGAVEHIFDDVVDPAVCTYECDHRVFAECQALDKHPYDPGMPMAERRHIPIECHISVAELKEMAALPDALVVDVREPEEYAKGHVPGSLLLPLRNLMDHANELPHDRTLLLVCRAGRRSLRAVAMLMDMGFTRLYQLRPGILGWRAAGLPLEHGPYDERS